MNYILTGSNWFGIKRRLDELRDEFVSENGELAVENIDGEEANFEQIKSALETPAFLSNQKLIIINRLAKNKEVSGRIDELINSSADTTAIIVEPEIDKRGTYYKSLKKLKGFEEYKEFDEQVATNWLIEQAGKKGGELSRTDASLVVELAGNNQQKLSNELEKLLAYNKTITRKNIELLIEPVPKSSIFNLMDAAFSGNLRETLRIYGDQRAQGTEPLSIVGLLAWQLHAVALVQSDKSKNLTAMSQESGINSFVLQKSSRIADRLDRTKIQKFTDDLLELNVKFKTTAIDQDNALKNLLASLT